MTAATATVTIRLNGRPHALPAGATVADLLRSLAVVTPLVAVEINRKVIPRERHAEVRLCAEDAVEIVQFVGGG